MQELKQKKTTLQKSYDVIIIGGAMIGTSIAWFTSANPDFKGKILVIEKDPSLEFSSTARSNSSIRQQFSNELNIKISQFSADYICNFKSWMGNDERITKIFFDKIGYLYLANKKHNFENFEKNKNLQNSLGIPTKILNAAELSQSFPFLNTKGLLGGSYNVFNEGYFDAMTILKWWKKKSIENEVKYLKAEVTSLNKIGKKIVSIRLKNGTTIKADFIVNATGVRAKELVNTKNFKLPVEPRKRYTFLFKTKEPVIKKLPLIIDPSGLHVRSDSSQFLCGCAPEKDLKTSYDDFCLDQNLWEKGIWPILAERIPHFESIKLVNSWAGHYEYNFFDQNALVGLHPEFSNFYLANGFSGHGLQQSPAIGRGISELIIYKKYKSLDLKPLEPSRVLENKPFLERAII